MGYRYITEAHRSDEQGRPAGGETHGKGIDIVWQDGPLKQPVDSDGHTADCEWARAECDYKPTFRYCPHAEHACNCRGGSREPNGAFVEGVLEAALGRLEFYQRSEFRCRENALAITKIEEAIHWLQHRTADREARGVEGTHHL